MISLNNNPINLISLKEIINLKYLKSIILPSDFLFFLENSKIFFKKTQITKKSSYITISEDSIEKFKKELQNFILNNMINKNELFKNKKFKFKVKNVL